MKVLQVNFHRVKNDLVVSLKKVTSHLVRDNETEEKKRSWGKVAVTKLSENISTCLNKLQKIKTTHTISLCWWITSACFVLLYSHDISHTFHAQDTFH